MWEFQARDDLTDRDTTLEQALKDVRSIDEFVSRTSAAVILHEVAAAGDSGNYEISIDPEDVGRALARIMSNCPGLSSQEILGRLIMGYFNRQPE